MSSDRLLLLAGAAAVLVLGWRLFWFLTDDAFIAFRYVSNSHLGYGYTWNPPPFRPVEGYTSFLWVALLDLTWRVIGVTPPDAANGILLLFAFLTLVLVAVIVGRMTLRPDLDSHRTLFLGLVLTGILTNRTFLAWSSSGLETALFNFLLLLWVFECAFPLSESSPLRWLRPTAAATLLALARPDGLLAAGATLGWIGWATLRAWRRQALVGSQLLSGAPLLATGLHLAWRRHTYGEWVPNTYHAKYVEPWPESGARYLLSFILEYALWVWLIALVLVVWRATKTRPAGGPAADSPPGAPPATEGLWIAAVSLALHLGYYTFVIGGDHFEYRVYSHLVPLAFLSFLWLLNRLPLGARSAALALAAFIALSLPVPWIHWAESRHLASRQETHMLRIPLVMRFPWPVRWYARWFDTLQFWLIERFVCLRHQEHKVYQLDRERLYPPRAAGLRITGDGFPVLFATNVGVAGWTLPHVSVLDGLGLNDHVIARSPVPAGATRYMTHERRPPHAYVAALRPNVVVHPGGRVEIRPRVPPLTAAEISAIESHWWNAVRRPAPSRSRMRTSRRMKNSPGYASSPNRRSVSRPTCSASGA